MKAFDERRFGIVLADPERIMTLLNLGMNPRQFLLLPITDKIPADSRVVSVNVDHGTRSFEIMICSEQLPPLRPGERAPYLNETFVEFRTVDLDAIVARNKPQVTVLTDRETRTQALYLNGDRIVQHQTVDAADIAGVVFDSLFTLRNVYFSKASGAEFPENLDGLTND